MAQRPAYASETEAEQHWARYPQAVLDMATGVFNAPSETPLALRQAVEAYTARLAGANRQEMEVPANIEPYLRKVGLYAYKVVDEDIEELKANGHSESAIYELTIAAAVGAGLARVERVMALLEEEEEA